MRLRSLVGALLATLALAACGGAGEEPEPPPAPAAEQTRESEPTLSSTPPPAVGGGSSPAINAITVDLRDGTIMVGTGPALFIVRPGEREGERLLGQLTTPSGPGTVSGNLVVRFTGPKELLASGHPQDGDLPENLPLIRSVDHGATWEAVPDTAEADYHELEVAGDLLLAVSVDAPDIQVSRDGGRSWETRTPPDAPIDVVVNPDDPQQWAVSTEQGTFVSGDGGGSWRLRDPTQGARLAWPAADELISVDRAGTVRASTDGGARWKDRGEVGGLPSELTVGGRKAELFAGVVGGKVRRSSDGGRSWSTIATLR